MNGTSFIFRMHPPYLLKLEDDLQFNGDAQRKTGDADYRANSHVFFAEYISQKIRSAIRDRGLIDSIS